ncbi:putative calcium-binding protein CML19 [Elaeis guineensis]|uniref:Calcium-binding protein CML19 n=1 Tax=Elaeis guineensis var. tenera TaxID=51953 RepID=A0A6I9S5A4_ELAGV|nr:putative calcium-binding protein CML19 [Elaeis guineensis]
MASLPHSKTEQEASPSLDPSSSEKVGDHWKFERLFGRFDVDADAKISSAELRLMMRTVGEDLSLEEAEAVVRSADKDGDGLLDLEEFVGLVGVEGEEEEEKERELREAFGMYEMEGEGCITPRSLKRMLSRLGASRELEDCQAMICRFDLNGDGVISFDEFKVMMMSS